MAGAKGDKTGASNAGGQTKGRGPRRRTLLNLGIPFVPVDDFINQAENAVAMGYRVLEDVVNEIKSGYDEAVEYNKKHDDANQSGDPAPPIPWQKVVDRVERLNDLTLGAMERGNRIFMDSIAAGMNATNKLAKTLAQARIDADEQRPTLAGPVFAQVQTEKFGQGQTGAKAEWEIDHPGLTRLRILVKPSPLQQLQSERGKGVTHTLTVANVTFEPDPKNREKRCLLKIEFGNIPQTQEPGKYRGDIIASNFDLLIARVEVVIVVGATAPSADSAKAR